MKVRSERIGHHFESETQIHNNTHAFPIPIPYYLLFLLSMLLYAYGILTTLTNLILHNIALHRIMYNVYYAYVQ